MLYELARVSLHLLQDVDDGRRLHAFLVVGIGVPGVTVSGDILR